MTFLDPAAADEACAIENERYNEALGRWEEANSSLDDARDTLESERSVWDGSTFGTGAAIGTIIAACLLPEPFSKIICLGGVLGGGLGVAGSEIDRQADIASAEAAVEQAELLLEMAESDLELATGAAFGCVFHYISKGAE